MFNQYLQCRLFCFRTTIALSVVLGLCGCYHPETAAPAVVEPIVGTRVAFDSFVNVNYGKSRSLPGWRTTRTVIETTLGLWYEQLDIRQAVTDGTPSDLQMFLRNLPGPEACDISVVYLGSIQSDSASWEFVNGQSSDWRHLLDIAPPPEHPGRIIILDACHAGAVRSIPDWKKRFGAVTLLASGQTELTYQFLPSALLPIDVAKHYPAGWAWGQTHLPADWKQHISYLGLIWIQTAARLPAAPENHTDWKAFFEACVHEAATFRQTISLRWGSTLQVF